MGIRRFSECFLWIVVLALCSIGITELSCQFSFQSYFSSFKVVQIVEGLNPAHTQCHLQGSIGDIFDRMKTSLGRILYNYAIEIVSLCCAWQIWPLIFGILAMVCPNWLWSAKKNVSKSLSCESEPPELELVDSISDSKSAMHSKSRFGANEFILNPMDRDNWYTYDPTFGVISKEILERWNYCEVHSNRSSERPRKIPPVRFTK